MPKNVNLGCGGNKLDGFNNYDSELDISKPLPFADNSVEFILAEHVVEHIAAHDAVRFLQECRRVLSPGGVFRLCIPVINRLPSDHALDIVFGHGHQAAYSTDLVYHLFRIVGFKNVVETPRKPIDGHWRVIGIEKDDLETLRIEAVK
jgi:predicted SAM-dependent methyltransferase